MNTPAAVGGCTSCGALYPPAPGDKGLCAACRRFFQPSRPGGPGDELGSGVGAAARGPQTACRKKRAAPELRRGRAVRRIAIGAARCRVARAGLGASLKSRRAVCRNAWTAIQHQTPSKAWASIQRRASDAWIAVRRPHAIGRTQVKRGGSIGPGTPSRVAVRDASATRGTHRHAQATVGAGVEGLRRRSGRRRHQRWPAHAGASPRCTRVSNGDSRRRPRPDRAAPLDLRFVQWREATDGDPGIRCATLDRRPCLRWRLVLDGGPGIRQTARAAFERTHRGRPRATRQRRRRSRCAAQRVPWRSSGAARFLRQAVEAPSGCADAGPELVAGPARGGSAGRRRRHAAQRPLSPVRADTKHRSSCIRRRQLECSCFQCTGVQVAVSPASRCDAAALLPTVTRDVVATHRTLR